MKSRREEQREATIEEIKNLAWEQMRQMGPANLSLRQITQQMRMSSAAIFRYFENREALLDALTLDAYRVHNQILADAFNANSDKPMKEQLKSMAMAYRDWAVRNPEKYLLMYGTTIPGYQPDWSKLIPVTSEGLKLLVNVLYLDRRAGTPREMVHDDIPVNIKMWFDVVISDRDFQADAESLLLALRLWSRLHGMISLELVGQLGLLVGDVDAYYQMEVDKMLDYTFK
ncbi:MAG: TetR/AcrR family transcriptional regulator [Anaerolineae bacterium]|nr:TetR/AcrR family transcriptional regulator [Anaerolineae bacterium]